MRPTPPLRAVAAVIATGLVIGLVRDGRPIGAAQAIPVGDNVTQAWFRWRALGLAGEDVRHIVTDTAFPPRVCAWMASGRTTCLAEWPGDSARTWQRLPASVDGPVTPDALDAEALYSASLNRFDRRLGQATPVSPTVGLQLQGRSGPAALAYSADGRTLYAGLAALWRTTSQGQSWTAAGDGFWSGPEPSSADRITTVGVSPIDSRVVWAGTSLGTVHVTRDGGLTWAVVTPPTADANRLRITAIEPSRFDPLSAYVTATGPETTDGLWRTRDRGLSWTDLSASLADRSGATVVREDLLRRGLLFAATRRGVLVSFDDGDRWQPLGGAWPSDAATWLTLRDADVYAATRTSGVFVLEDFSPLRQVTPDVLRADAFLFRPTQAWRVRALTEESSEEPPSNPSATGVALSYWLGPTRPTNLRLEVIETLTGDVIRRFGSEPAEQQPGDAQLSLGPGLHRVMWDLRYARPEADASAPPGARVVPGTYQVRLTVGGRSIRQSVSVRLDPRLRATIPDLTAQRTLARALDARRRDVAAALAGGRDTEAVRTARDELRRVAAVVASVDARPSAAVEAAAAAALLRAAAAIGRLDPP